MSLFDRIRKGKRQKTGIDGLDAFMEQLASQEVPGRREVVERFRVSEDDFNVLYASYHFSLKMSGGDTGGWNTDVDEFARELGALTEGEMEAAQTDLHQAVLNRIKLRLVTNDMYGSQP